MITIFKNTKAISYFRQQNLNKKLSNAEINNILLTAEFVHFVSSDIALSNNEINKLETLLTYQDKILKNTKNILIIIPRLGTISPWSSKATDIVHLCGLETVNRVERGIIYHFDKVISNKLAILAIIMDKMTEIELASEDDARLMFNEYHPKQVVNINILDNGKTALNQANIKLGLALNNNEIDYLFTSFSKLKRNPSDVELMMFAQANSEHCRHKIFNANWIIDDKKQDLSLFTMIKNTYKQNPEGLLSVYSDNSAVMEGFSGARFYPNSDNLYQENIEKRNILIKVETHNHPTAIEPFSGSATGSGGEIRDEGATGRGSKAKVGLCGFSLSNLNIDNAKQSWEFDYGKPKQIKSALDIIIEAPVGAASFNNEFGRPNICGYFRTYLQKVGSEVRGYHKPIMLAGGLGHIQSKHIQKDNIPVASQIIVLGGPAMLIGLGGGAASSIDSGSQSEALDFASVQRSNPEMQRRCQEVIDSCANMGDDNPIISIHDVGAGGLSNALPELINDSNKGAIFNLRDIPCDDKQLSPMEIWCNESQERYVLAISQDNIDVFSAICKRERAPFAILGQTTAEQQLVLADSLFNNKPINMPMAVLLGNTPKTIKNIISSNTKLAKFNTNSIALDDAIYKVLSLPSVASKNFLITIGDRTVTGLVAREQMVGKWQTPVADCAISINDYNGFKGEAMAIGEKAPLAICNAKASARMAIGEALTNLMAVVIDDISDISLSANWMCASGSNDEDYKLFQAVKTIAMKLCPELGLTIPVGKDSLSMKSTWNDNGTNKQVVAPLSLIISAFSKIADVRKQQTPVLDTNIDSELLLIDLGFGKNRLGGSALAQVYNATSDIAPDLDDAKIFKKFFTIINKLNNTGLINSYHDRSDGGFLISLLEMAFASHCGVDIYSKNNLLNDLFNEELGCVIQINNANKSQVLAQLTKAGLKDATRTIAKINNSDDINIYHNDKLMFNANRAILQQKWSSTSYEIARLRDNPECVQQEYDSILDNTNGLKIKLSFDVSKLTIPYINKGIKPRVAILREQGINGQIEMAAAFNKVGFDAVDVHMSDILLGNVSLNNFNGLVACGGFSYGDVLGAGRGWASSILYSPLAKDEFAKFFIRDDNFTLGVCNGCQMLSNLVEIIPASENFPKFICNKSEQFEARFSSVKVQKSKSIFFSDMAGSILPIAIAHSEGRAVFKDNKSIDNFALKYVDHSGLDASKYPNNPNGSDSAVAGVVNGTGQVTIMMPHPERVFRSVQNSYHPKDWGEYSPWIKMFLNARKHLD